MYTVAIFQADLHTLLLVGLAPSCRRGKEESRSVSRRLGGGRKAARLQGKDHLNLCLFIDWLPFLSSSPFIIAGILSSLPEHSEAASDSPDFFDIFHVICCWVVLGQLCDEVTWCSLFFAFFFFLAG